MEYNIDSEVIMKKRIIILLGLGLTFMIVPFLLNTYSILRIISILLGTILITLSLCLKKKKNIFMKILIPIFLLAICYGVDTLLFYSFKRVPVFSYQIKSSTKMKTYNSFFYRVYDCNKDLVVDYGYQKSFMCESNTLDTININTFLQDSKESFKKYHHKFVKISGKISKITGNESLELSAYSETSDILNGYVNFNLNNTVVVETNEDLSMYHIYDYVEVIGLVDKINDNTITLKDTLLIPSNIYNEYSYEVIYNEDGLEDLNIDKNYYYYNINSINIVYNDKNIYELSYLFLDEKLKYEDIILNKEYSILKDEEDIEVAKVYKLDKFNILECSMGKTIFVDNKAKLTVDMCEL